MIRVLVIGAGTAGIPATLAALDAGAEVVLVERETRVGGVLWSSGGITSGAGTRIQRDKGIEDSPARHFADVQRIGRGRANVDILRRITDGAGATIDWFESIGARFTAESPTLAGFELYDTARSYTLEADPALGPWKGRVLADLLQQALERRLLSPHLTLHLSSNLEELVRDESGRVSGATVVTPGGRITIDADVVILSTGGYVAGQAVLRRLHPSFDRLITQAPDFANGDGLVVAERAGAAIVNTDLVLPNPGGVEDPRKPGFRLEGGQLPIGRPPAEAGDIWVNRAGRRFFPEDAPNQADRERAIAEQPDAVMFAVFDEPMRVQPGKVGEWTREKLGEPSDGGLIVSARSIGELAQRMLVPERALQETVEAYNRAVATGLDVLGRRSLPKAIDTPPFHSVLTRGVLIMTFAGVSANGEFEVLDLAGTPIPGLYAAGEVLGAGQLQGAGYSSGFMIVSSVTSGRLAALAAVRSVKAAKR